MEGVGSSEWVLAVGLFGFAGGVTNWLAVKMLLTTVADGANPPEKVSTKVPSSSSKRTTLSRALLVT